MRLGLLNIIKALLSDMLVYTAKQVKDQIRQNVVLLQIKVRL